MGKTVFYIKFIEKIEELADFANVVFKIQSVDLPNNGNSPVFQLRGVGEFKQLFYYLELVENLPYQVVFKQVNLGKFKDEWKLDIIIELLGYYQRNNNK